MAWVMPMLAGTAATVGSAGSAAASLAAATGAGGAAGTAALAGTAATSGLLGAGGALSLGKMAMVGGTAMNAYGQMQSAKAQSQAAMYNAQMTQMQGQAEAERIRRESAREQGRLRAAIGKSGVTTAGTPLMVMAESEANAELDILNTQWSTGRQVDLNRMQARSAMTAGRIGAGTSLLAGAGRLYG